MRQPRGREGKMTFQGLGVRATLSQLCRPPQPSSMPRRAMSDRASVNDPMTHGAEAGASAGSLRCRVTCGVRRSVREAAEPQARA